MPGTSGLFLSCFSRFFLFHMYICLDHTKLISTDCFCLVFWVLFDRTIVLNTDSGYSLLSSSLSVEELGGWKTFLAPPGAHSLTFLSSCEDHDPFTVLTSNHYHSLTILPSCEDHNILRVLTS